MDLVLPDIPEPAAIEIKSGETVSSSFFDPVRRFSRILDAPGLSCFVVYGGEEEMDRSGVRCVPWHKAWTLSSIGAAH